MPVYTRARVCYKHKNSTATLKLYTARLVVPWADISLKRFRPSFQHGCSPFITITTPKKNPTQVLTSCTDGSTLAMVYNGVMIEIFTFNKRLI